MISVRPLAVAAMLCGLTLPALAEVPKTNEEREKIMKSLHWMDGGTLALTDAEATLDVPKEYKVLDKEDAQAFMQVNNGGPRQLDIDAVVIDPKTHSLVMFQNVQEGYVKSDDWNKVDAAAMLKEIIEGTEQANEERAQEGIPAGHVVGWTQPPAFDAANNTVQWGITGTVGGEKVVNAVELVLGRRGYERFTWIGDADQSPVAFLTQARKSFAFKTGSTYGDYKEGDKVAAYGLAALITAAVGAKVAGHLGLIAGAALLIKKALAFIVAGAVIVWRSIKSLFTGKKKQEQMTSSAEMPPGAGSPPPT